MVSTNCMCCFSSREQKIILAGRTVEFGGLLPTIDYPEGVAAEVITLHNSKFIESQPPALTEILDRRGAQQTYQEFVRAIDAAPKTMFGYIKPKEAYKATQSFIEKFKQHNISVYFCHKIVGTKQKKTMVWIVYVDQEYVLASFTPEHVWDGKDRCDIS
eukprot:gnl/TRDRNA2_/TRDRNA2_200057_c0_seq1.p1 gnl/TRDRNA2_/TRDRNA2_200057_c0~~gnl/TRDRNA2_/TRDRNA2_200057_c0_seq1.p1  ORF type:complete len:185 (+),score=35.13 gnl/TRDRNA2_/TRDRNA2_200057_c0_seq1:81-557(+)